MKIKSLKNCESKMSKSEPGGCIFLTDEPELLHKKIIRTRTDSIYGLTYDKINRKNLANLIDIMAAIRQTDPYALSLEYMNCGHETFKELLSKHISEFFSGFREKYTNISEEKTVQILKMGTSLASEIASHNLDNFLSCIYK